MADSLDTPGITYKAWFSIWLTPQTVTKAQWRAMLAAGGLDDVNDALGSMTVDGGFMRTGDGIFWTVQNSPSLQPCPPGNGNIHGSPSAPEVITHGAGNAPNTVVKGRRQK